MLVDWSILVAYHWWCWRSETSRWAVGRTSRYSRRNTTVSGAHAGNPFGRTILTICCGSHPWCLILNFSMDACGFSSIELRSKDEKRLSDEEWGLFKTPGHYSPLALVHFNTHLSILMLQLSPGKFISRDLAGNNLMLNAIHKRGNALSLLDLSVACMNLFLSHQSNSTIILTLWWVCDG